MAEPGKQSLKIKLGTIMKNKFNIILIILLQIILTACGKQQTPSQQINTQNPIIISSKSQNTIPPTTQPAPTTNNITGNNRNPFQANSNNSNNSVATPTQAINQYSVSDLQMVGTITSDSQQYALIASPDGNTCTVSIGDKIGKEAAEVISITTEQVILKITRDFNGSSYQQLVELSLNKQSTQSSPGLSV